MDLKKIDVPNKLYEYRDELKKEHDTVVDFKRFDIVYVEKKNKEQFIGIILDNYGMSGYVVKYINENGEYASKSFTGNAIENITLVERQYPIEVEDECDL